MESKNVKNGTVRQTRSRSGGTRSPDVSGSAGTTNIRERIEGSVAGMDQIPDHAGKRESPESGGCKSTQISGRTDGELFLWRRHPDAVGVRSTGTLNRVTKVAKKYPPQQFLNRELGLLEFNRRVLAQAENPTVPPLERLKYLCIVSSNLDEFFEIRVAGLKEQIKVDAVSAGADGLTPRQTLELVHQQAHQLIERQYQLF